MKKCIKIIFTLILLSMILLPVYSKEKITIIIDGEKYQQDYPDNLDDSKDMIDSLVELYNNLDKEFNAYAKDDKLYLEKLHNDINDLQIKNEELINNMETTKCEFDKYKKDVEKLLKQHSKFEGSVIFGPTVNFSGTFGTFTDLFIDYRLFGNFHFGLNLGMSVYNNIDTMEGRLGISIGYSFF